jgi:mannobiose 2-epimerase
MNLNTELERLSAKAGEHLFGHILPFWCGPAVDRVNGGWMAWLSNDLKPDRTQPKGLILNARVLWAFSAAHRVRPEPLYFEMAERAFEVVMNLFWDSEQGGAFWRLDDRFEVMDDSKKIYGQAFYIYALTEYHLAFGSAAALARAQHLFRLVERHAHDPGFGGYMEVCRHDWSAAGPEARLSDKDMNEKKSMNTHLHVLEAYANLHRVWPEASVADRLRELVELFLERILDTRTNHLHHFFDEQWNVRSNTCTFGHDIEASWLLCEAAGQLGDPSLSERVRRAALRLAQTTLREGLGTDGGLAYEGRDGAIIDAGREGWPQAEAMVGFLNAFEMGNDESFFTAARQVWRYIEKHLVDRVHGEWFWRVNPDGRPDARLPKVSEWKGPYHATRACLEIMKRADRLVGAQPGENRVAVSSAGKA